MKSSGQSAAWHAQSSGFNLALNKPGLVVYARNLNTQEVEAERLEVQGYS